MIQPIIHEKLTHILVRHFEAQPKQAAQLATKIITVLQAYDLDIVAEDWMTQEPKEVSWESLVQVAEGLVQDRNGIKPWNPPELQ